MATDVMSMEDIRAAGERLGINFTEVDLDSIRLPPGEDFGIIRFCSPQLFDSLICYIWLEICFRMCVFISVNHDFRLCMNWYGTVFTLSTGIHFKISNLFSVFWLVSEVSVCISLVFGW